MKIKSILILSTFLFFFIANKVYLYQDIVSQNESLAVVNISGKQRMYSQKIVKQVLTLSKNTRLNELSKASLQSTLKNFTEAHKYLKENHVKKYNEYYLNELFTTLEPNFKAIVTNTTKIIENFENSEMIYVYKMELNLASNNFLPIMDEIVKEYEIIGKDRGDKILKREYIFNSIFAILILVIIIFIIMPVSSKLKSYSIKIF